MKKFSKTFYCLLFTVILSLFISCAVYADNDFVVWTMSDDGKILTGNNTAYEYYGDDELFYEYETSRLSDEYIYANVVRWKEDTYNVYSHRKDGDILELISYHGQKRIYVTQKGKIILDGFLGGDNANYRLWANYNESSEFDKEMLNELQKNYISSDSFTSVDVKALKAYDCYEITTHDMLNYFSRTIGAFYTYPGKEMYYIDYLSLGNQYFDADGNFSYRSGTVDMISLDEADKLAVENSLKNTEYFYSDYIWEDSGIYYTEQEAISLTPVFYVGLIILGFVLPLPFLVCGLIFPRTKKFGKPGYWYIMSASSLLWILAALTFTIIIFAA